MYFRFGNTAGACASLIVGTVVSAGGILMPRNWADSIYPWLERAGWQENIGAVQKAVSGPFLPYITWLTDASAWHFCSLRRPSGIPVLFSFEGTPWMSSSGSFSMRRNGSTHRLDCIDGVSHVFGGGGFEKCELRNQGRGEQQHHAFGKAQTERQRINLPVRERNGNRRTPIPLHLRSGK